MNKIDISIRKQKIKKIILFLILIFIVIFSLQMLLKRNSSTFVVYGDSMLPNLHSNEKISIKKNLKTLNRGDIVIFQSPEKKDKLLIKRIIGLPGEKIQIKNNQIYINNNVISESYIKEPMNPYLNKRLEEVFVIPTESYYLMGDNRNLSNDSRNFGPISIKSIIGKVN